MISTVVTPLYPNHDNGRYYFLGTYERMDLYVTAEGDKLAARHGPEPGDLREWNLADSDQYMKRRDVIGRLYREILRRAKGAGLVLQR